MKKNLLLVLLSVFSFNAIHAEITWELSDDGILTISGTDMPDYDFAPWNSQIEKIKKVIIENGVSNIGASAFRYCYNLASVTFPNSVTSIGKNAFHDCSNLTSITIPNSVTWISNYAFYNCSSLTSIIIPNSVTSIGECAFVGCTALNSVTILSKNPPTMSSDSFDTNTTIHVLAGCKAAYEATEFWKDFTIVEDATTGIDAVEDPATISEEKIFSISGQRLDKAAKGVNIINGKKVLVK